MLRFTNMSFSEIEDEARSKHIAKLDFFKTVRASVEEVGLSSLLIIPSFSTCSTIHIIIVTIISSFDVERL